MENELWYALYTSSRTEKKTYQRLIDAGVTTYLPLVKTLKQWSDRKKWVEEPLFRSYIFVRINKTEYIKVLNVPGVVRFITFEGKAVPIPDLQIEAIRQFINLEEIIDEPLEKLIIGDKVEITRGQLFGLAGYLVDYHGKQKVRIEIESIGHSIILTIPKAHLKVIN